MGSLVPQNVGLSKGVVRITPGLKNSITAVKAAWFIYEYHFFLKISNEVPFKNKNLQKCLRTKVT